MSVFPFSSVHFRFCVFSGDDVGEGSCICDLTMLSMRETSSVLGQYDV